MIISFIDRSGAPHVYNHRCCEVLANLLNLILKTAIYQKPCRNAALWMKSTEFVSLRVSFSDVWFYSAISLAGFSITMCLPTLFLILVTVLTLLYALCYYNRKELKPLLYFKKSRISMVIKKGCKRLHQEYKPTFWAQNQHLQTILPWIWWQDEMEFNREYLQMADKGVIALDWVALDGNKVITKVSPVMLLIPDLTGAATDLVAACSEALTRKFRPVVFNRRGHGGSSLTTYRLQSFGDASDLDEAVEFISHMYPYSEIFAVGFSTGSGLLMSYLGETGVSSKLNAAVCISPCYDAEALFKCNKIPEPYNWFWTLKLKSILRQHPCLEAVINYNIALQSSSLKELDERVYAKLNQFNSLEEYWKYNDPMRNITNISIPVLCISALDDPICPRDTIPFSLFKTSNNLFLVTTDIGGHCGFVEDLLPSSWANKLAIDYLETVFNQGVPKQTDDNHLHFLPGFNGTRNRSYTT